MWTRSTTICVRLMQDTLDALAAERRLPDAGMRVQREHKLAAPIESVWAIVSDPERALSFMSGITRWEVAGDQPTGLGARYRMLLRVGSAEVGRTDRDRGVGRTVRSGLDISDRAGPALALSAAEARVAAPASSCGWPTAWPAPDCPDGWPSGSPRPPSAVTCVAACSSSSAWSSTSSCASGPPRGARREPAEPPAFRMPERRAYRRAIRPSVTNRRTPSRARWAFQP